MIKIELKKFILGRPTTILMPDGEEHDAQYAVVELDELTASHNEKTFEWSKGYPKREDGENLNADFCCAPDIQAKVLRNAKDLKPPKSVVITEGAFGTPIIDTKGIVLSGNKRIMSFKLAVSDYPEQYANYKTYLLKNAQQFRIDVENGKFLDFDTGDETSFQKPVLVRFDYAVKKYTAANIAAYNEIIESETDKISRFLSKQHELRGVNDGKEFEKRLKTKTERIKGINFTIDANILREALPLALVSASEDELRPAMTGINVELTPEGAQITATDGHLLYSFYTPSVKVKEKEAIDFIMPAPVAKNLLTALSKKAKTVQFKYNGEMKANDGDTKVAKITATLDTGEKIDFPIIDARYPEWRLVVPSDATYAFRCNRQAVLKATNALLVSANKTTNQLIYTFDKDETTVYSVDYDYEIEGTTTLKTKRLFGKTIQAGFNGRFINRIMSNFSHDNFTWEMRTPTRATLVVPDRPKDENVVFCLLMPVVLAN